jgi:type I restriction enzyme S subunit
MSNKWQTVELQDIAVVERGKFSVRPRNDPKYFGGEIPFLQTGDVAGASGATITTYSQTLNSEGLKVSKYFPAGTLLITIAANIGDVAEVGFGFACTDSLVAVQPKEGINKSWLKFFLQTQKNYFESRATQNAQANINLQTIRPLLVELPPLPEQTAIASLLSTWDLAIGKAERLIDANEKHLNSLKQDLLTGSKRIQSFNKKWQRYKLSEILNEHCEQSSGQEEVFSVSVHKGLINQIEHLGRVYAAKDTSNYNVVKLGDVVYTKSPTGAFPYGIVKQSRVDFSVIVSPLYGVFTPRSQQLGTFLDFYFESPVRTRNYLWPIIQKGAKNTINITNATFLSNSLYLPSCDEETEVIAAILTTAR